MRILTLIFLAFLSLSSFGKTKDDFAKKYSELHKAQDVAGALQLVHWERVTPEIKRQITASFTEDFINPLESVYVSKMASTRFENEGSETAVLQPNLPVVAVMLVTFKPKSKTRSPRSTSYFLGMHEGRYRITVVAPAKK